MIFTYVTLILSYSNYSKQKVKVWEYLAILSYNFLSSVVGLDDWL